MMMFVAWWVAMVLNIIGGAIQFVKIGEGNHPAAEFVGWLIGNSLSIFIFYCSWQYLTLNCQ